MRRIGGEDEDSAQESTEDPLAKMIDIGAREYSAELPTPAVLDHAQLNRLTMPVYVGIAGKDSLAGAAAAHDVFAMDGEVFDPSVDACRFEWERLRCRASAPRPQALS